MTKPVTIEDLTFKTHPSGMGGTQAIVKFPNGYGASIITGSWFYSSSEAPYEIAVLDSADEIDYTTPITCDVCGYLTESEANDILAKIATLPPETEE